MPAGPLDPPSVDDRSSALHTSARRLAWLFGLLGTLVSFLGSWHVSIWSDEGVTITAADRSLPQLWRMIGHIDTVHALYYAFMHFWLDAFGSSATSLRLPSAIAAGVATAGVYVLVARLSDARTATAASLVFLALPRATWMGIEGRSFAFTAAVAVWLTVLLVLALSSNRTSTWTGYAVLAGLGTVINIYLALLVVAHAVTVFLWRQGTRAQQRRFALAAIIGLAIALPVVYRVSQQSRQLGADQTGLLRWIRDVFVNDWFLGQTPTAPGSSASGYTGSSLWRPASVLLACVAWALVLTAVVRWWRNRPRSAGPTTDSSAVLAWTIPWLVVPTILVAAYGFGRHSTNLLNPRYFTFLTPAVAIAVGAGIISLAKRWMQWTAIAIVALLAAPVYVSQRGVFAKSGYDWSVAANFMRGHKGPRDGVYFAPRTAPTGPTVTLTTRRAALVYPSGYSGLKDITIRTTGPQDDTISGTSYRLAARTGRLVGLSVVWMVRYRDYPEAALHADSGVLRRAGFVPGRSWSGPVTVITEYVRSR